MLHRNLIKEDIIFDGVGREELFVMINRFKHLLLQNGVKKGETTTVIIPKSGVMNIACVFACLELGLPLWQNSDSFWNLDSDVVDFIKNFTEEDRKKLPVNRVRLFDDASKKLHETSYKHFNLYIGQTENIDFEIDAYDLPDETDDIQPWSVDDNDTAFIRTENFWKQKENPFQRVSHAETLWNTYRPLMQHYKDKNVGIGLSYQHRNAFERSILPSLMMAKSITSLVFPPPLTYGTRASDIFMRRGIPRLQKVDVIYALEDDNMEMIFDSMLELGQDFIQTLHVVPHEGQIYDQRYVRWEDELNVKFL